MEIEKDLPKYKIVHTDRYHVYENLHRRRAEKFELTNWNERLHSIIRDKLAMFRRKTKAYAKSVMAVERTLALFFIYWDFLPMDL